MNFPPRSIGWLAGDSLLCDACPVYTFNALRRETFVLVAEHSSGCVLRDSLQLRVRRSGFYLPNAIAPEGSDANRFFEVSPSSGVLRIDGLQIFDRWGNQVFSAGPFAPGDAAGRWDGTFRGRVAQQGVYVYWVNVLYIDGSSELIGGDVTVVR